jgi:hypothetical protein
MESDPRAFLDAFEAGTLQRFEHRDHIRMAWLYLREDGLEGGRRRIAEGLRRFLALKGVPVINETVTQFWIEVVWLRLSETPELSEFEAFIGRHPGLLDKRMPHRHYSEAVLFSAEARDGVRDPDLKPLPWARPVRPR